MNDLSIKLTKVNFEFGEINIVFRRRKVVSGIPLWEWDFYFRGNWWYLPIELRQMGGDLNADVAAECISRWIKGCTFERVVGLVKEYLANPGECH